MKVFRQIVSLAFASLVLFSSSYLMAGLHICNGEVQHVALFSKADGCEMEKLPPCHRQEAKSCCEDKTIVHEGQSYNFSVAKIIIPELSATYIIHHPVVLADIIPTINNTVSAYIDYDPPVRTEDITISLHTFLI
ncbi:MAG: hypothetical protein JST43_07635 [Bacteroidetes bacterium]|nr:hypothetical protein [Bacteroidota bacterium]MBS1540919.1 hypothetical protein [Bacteroidota bacterium]